MIKILLLSIFLTFTLTACGETCVGSTCSGGSDGIAVENAYIYKHINGHLDEKDEVAYVMWEFELGGYIKYQIAYTSCTCRDLQYNYRQVAYVEISREGVIQDLRFESVEAGNGHEYIVGLWGDSSPTPAGKTKEDYYAELVDGYLIGKTQADLATISTMDDMDTNVFDVDGYAGGSVTVNNMVRMLQGLFEYHNEKYGS